MVHYCVANMPGAVARTSTFGLTNATLPWILRLAALGPKRAVEEDRALRTAANILGGRITHPAVAAAFDLQAETPEEAAAALA